MFGYLAAFLNTGSSKLNYVENDAILRIFDPLLKLGEGGLYLWSFTYDRTVGIHLMAVHSAAAEHGVLIKK